MGKYTIYRVSTIKNYKIYPNATTGYYNLFYMACPDSVGYGAKEWLLNAAVKRAGFENIDEYISMFPHQFNCNTAAGSLYVTATIDGKAICDNPKDLFKDSIEFDVVKNWHGWIPIQFMRTESMKNLNLISYVPISVEEAVGALHTIDSGYKATRNDFWFCDDWCEE